MSINELYDELEDINKKIKEEPRKALKRRREFKHQLEELEAERTRAGLHHDFALVDQINGKIYHLKQNQNNSSQMSDLKNEEKRCKKEILDIIVDYYENGYDIDDIIEIENILDDIYDDWFELSDFGKDSGYLFVEYVDDEEYNWIYSNPINEVKLNSKTLDNLKYEIYENNEVLLIFNKVLANESEKIDLIFYQEIIDEKLENLDNDDFLSRKFLMDLKELADKFDENQMKKLCDLFVDKYYMSEYKEFNFILKENEDKVDSSFYCNLIDNRINKLINSDYILHSEKRNIFLDLKEFADEFNENQTKKLCNLIFNEFYVSEYNEIKYILNINEDILDLDFYSNLIDNRINKLDDLNYFSYRNNISDLKEFADKFNENQIKRLCNNLIKNDYIPTSLFEIKYILEVNEDKLDADFYYNFIDNRIEKLSNPETNDDEKDEIISDLSGFADKFNENQIKRCIDLLLRNYYDSNYTDIEDILEANEDKFEKNEIYDRIIDKGLNILNDSELDDEVVLNLFKHFKNHVNNFSKEQLFKLYNGVINNVESGCAKDFNYILTNNKDILDYDEVSNVFIDSKIHFLRDIDSDYDAKNIMDDLKVFANSFNENQFNNLCKIIIENSNICNFARSFSNIVITNRYHSYNTNKIYNEIIDSRLQKLRIISQGQYISLIFNDLSVFSNEFNKEQILELCDLIKEEQLIGYIENHLALLSNNMKRFNDDEIDAKIKGVIIDVKLNELDKLTFGYPTAKNILGYLRSYSSSFSQIQANKLCDIALYNSQVYRCYICADNLRFILEANKEKIDSELYEEVKIKNNI